MHQRGGSIILWGNLTKSQNLAEQAVQVQVVGYTGWDTHLNDDSRCSQ